MKKAFRFIFSDKFNKLTNKTNDMSIQILLMNAGEFGISGHSKTDVDAEKTTEWILMRAVTSMLLVEKIVGKYNLYYLWTDGEGGDNANVRSLKRRKLQTNSEWFFTILKVLYDKKHLHMIDSTVPRGYDVGTVSRVKDIQEKLNWYKRAGNNKEENSIYIRVKKNTSSIGIFEVYRSHWQSVQEDLSALRIPFKVI